MKYTNIMALIFVMSAFEVTATMVNRGTIEKTNMKVEEPLNNSGTIMVDETLSLYDTTENSGKIEAHTIFVNGQLKNKQKSSLTAMLMFVSASCGLLENQGAFNIQQLHLPAFGTRLKLNLNDRTVIGSLYRGDDYLGGISFEPYWSKNKQGTITITDEQGKKHTFSDTTQNLEKFLEKALNEKVSVVALIAYLRSMTAKS